MARTLINILKSPIVIKIGKVVGEVVVVEMAGRIRDVIRKWESEHQADANSA